MSSRIVLGFLIASMSTSAQAMDLKTYMDQVVSRHHGLESLRASRESAEDKRKAGDLELSPSLSLKGSYLSDKKQPNFLGSTESQATEYSAALGKKFSTGTSLNLTALAGGYRQLGIASPAFAAYQMYGSGGLGLSFSQSLWKNGFGRSTRLRHEREAETAAAEAGSYDLQARQILTEAESSFWDYLYVRQQVEVSKASLERAQRIENWVGRRNADGIADQADLFNAKSLAASRRLQLLNLQDELVAAEKKVRDQLELSPEESLPKFEGDLKTLRNPTKMMEGQGRVVRLDAWLASKEARARDAAAREVEDSLRPDLVLSGAYSTNSFQSGGGYGEVPKDWTKADTPTAQVALTWTYVFETDAKQSALAQSKKTALASKLLAERKEREGQTAWTELLRRHEELTKKIESTGQLRELQMQRSKALQVKLSKGRAITTDVVNAEQDAADAELQWTRLQAEQRKIEAQSRLFISVKE